MVSDTTKKNLQEFSDIVEASMDKEDWRDIQKMITELQNRDTSPEEAASATIQRLQQVVEVVKEARRITGDYGSAASLLSLAGAQLGKAFGVPRQVFEWIPKPVFEAKRSVLDVALGELVRIEAEKEENPPTQGPPSNEELNRLLLETIQKALDAVANYEDVGIAGAAASLLQTAASVLSKVVGIPLSASLDHTRMTYQTFDSTEPLVIQILNRMRSGRG